MYFIVDTLVKAICFEIGMCFSIFVLPIIMHSCLGVPYLN
jgi:hypothetical protein